MPLVGDPFELTGTTRVLGIVGHPIVQVSAVFALADRVNERAESVGAVHLFRVRHDRVEGDTFDGLDFVERLTSLGHDVKSTGCLVADSLDLGEGRRRNEALE